MVRRRSNQAPRMGTILIAALLTIFAALVFFTNIVPASIAGFASGTLALYAAIAAFVILLVGIFVEGV
jgi:dolichol kinase